MTIPTDFLKALFASGDYILIRPIESWIEDKKKRSRVDYRGIRYFHVGLNGGNGWQNLDRSLRIFLKAIVRRSATERSNLFYGVCPRFGQGDGHTNYDQAWQICTVRALWCDIDQCTVDEARERIKAAGLPEPSIIVWSGNGCHLYWILALPFLIDDVGDPAPVFTEFIDQEPGKKKRPRKYILGQGGERLYLDIKRHVPALSAKAQLVQNVLSGITVRIGADHAFDLSRLLRLPGTMNRKDERNGRTPVPCELVECDPSRRYPFSVFAGFASASSDRKNIHTQDIDSANPARGCRGRSKSTGDWQRVSDYRPCPVCGKPDWCIYVGPDDMPEAAICARVESERRVGEAGWLHRFEESGENRQRRGRTLSRAFLLASQLAQGQPNLAAMAEQWRMPENSHQLLRLGNSLGLSQTSLLRLGTGWSDDRWCWSFPMRDADDRVVGIRLRRPDGSKLSVKGGHEGLFIPEGMDSGGRLLICEGPTDCAALLELGFQAVGRPSCTGGVKQFCLLVQRLVPEEVVIVSDSDEPGQRGAEDLASVLVGYCPSVRVIRPPDGVKDAREWKRLGATAAEVQASIDAVRKRRLVIFSEKGR